MFTYTFFRNPKNDALHLRITYERKKAEMELGIKTTEEELRSALSDRPKDRHTGIALTIRGIDAAIKALQREYLGKGGIPEGMDAKQIREAVRERIFFSAAVEKANREKAEEIEGSLFIPFFKKVTGKKKNESYQASCKYTVGKVEDYLGKDVDKFTFEDITLKWLRDFDEWLDDNGASQNTRAIHFKNIRTALNRAIDDELTNNYPFRRFKIKQEETRKRSLTVEELRKLKDYEVQPYQEMYRDIFMLSFYLIGINPVDLFNLERVTSRGRIEYKRAKTHKQYSVKVEPEALEIINKYKGDKKLLLIADRWSNHKDFAKNTNIALKQIGELKRVGRGGKKVIKAEWSDLTLYWARHTWATIAYSLDISYDTIAQALGHKNTGPSVTATYINFDEKKVDEANRKVLDWVLYGKK